MNDREQKFHEIDNQLEKMSTEEKHFVLWLLLKQYSEENIKEIPERNDTIEDYRKEKFYHGLCVDCNELIDALNFELWR